MKKLIYKLESKESGKKWEYNSIKELFDDPANDWLGVSMHTVSRIKKNSSYVNKFCIITKLDTEVIEKIPAVPAKQIFKIKKV